MKLQPQRSHKLQLFFFSPSSKIGKITIFKYYSDTNMKKKLPLGFISLQGKLAEDDSGRPGPLTRNVQNQYCQSDFSY